LANSGSLVALVDGALCPPAHAWCGARRTSRASA